MKLLTQLDFLLKPQSSQDRACSWRGRMSNKMLFNTQKIIDSGTLMELLFATKLFQTAGNVVLILICYNACNFFSQPCFDNHCLQNNYTGGWLAWFFQRIITICLVAEKKNRETNNNEHKCQIPLTSQIPLKAINLHSWNVLELQGAYRGLVESRQEFTDTAPSPAERSKGLWSRAKSFGFKTGGKTPLRVRPFSTHFGAELNQRPGL